MNHIAIPHQRKAHIWYNPGQPILDDGDVVAEGDHDLRAIISSRDEAIAYVAARRHQWPTVSTLIDEAWPA